MGQYLFPRQNDRKSLAKAISYFAHGGCKKVCTSGSVTNEGVAAGLFTASRVLILVVSVDSILAPTDASFSNWPYTGMGLADLGTCNR
jgi:hypothetical protein